MFDTFEGLDATIVPKDEQEYWGVSAEEKRVSYKAIYDSDFEAVRERFGKLSNDFQLIPGTIPESITASVLNDIDKSEPISFLHVDMNNSIPEVEALQAFYSRVAKGGVILFDDYAYNGYEYQKNAIDDACNKFGIETPICLPTGQGLILKSSV